MAIGSSARREERRPQVENTFGSQTDRVLDLLELGDLAWHDCFDDDEIPPNLIDDIILCSEGDVAWAIHYVRLAILDWRDVKVSATHLRSKDEDG